MPGIPPEPRKSQFEQVAKAIDSNAGVASSRKLVGGIYSRMDVLEYESPGMIAHKVVTR